MKIIPIFLIVIVSFSCTTMTDSVVASISEEEYGVVNEILDDIEDFRVNGNKDSLEQGHRKADSINLDSVYNNDYKGKIVGLLAITNYYKGNHIKARSYIEDLELINRDEELLWIAKSLDGGDNSLDILLEAQELLYEPEVLNYYLAEAYLNRGFFGEAAALYDGIILEEPKYMDYYQKQRDLAYNFLKNPPENAETGLLYLKDEINYKDLVRALELETSYFDQFSQDDIFAELLIREYFFNETNDIDLVQRKDLSYFLFKLYATRKTSLDLISKHNEFYISEPTEDQVEILEGLSPISDVPSYVYYFYPSLFLIEEEIMELPDGEKFYPLNSVSGEDVQRIIGNLKKRLD